MGNIPSALPDSNTCHSLRSKRLRNRQFFVPAIESVREQLPPSRSATLRSSLPQVAGSRHSAADLPSDGTRAQATTICCVRQRPLLKKELNLNDYSVFTGSSNLSDIFIANESAPQVEKPSAENVDYSTVSMWAHKGAFKLDNKLMYLEHHGYRFHDVFDPEDDSQEVYRRVIAPMVANATQVDGATDTGRTKPTATAQVACVLFYGQSGSGKTFTQEAVVDLALKDMFKILGGTQAESGRQLSWYLSCFEVYADKVSDLLQERAPVQLRQDGDGRIHTIGGSEEKLSSIEYAQECLARASRLRATEVTTVHEQSSRSHAVFRFLLKDDAEEGNPIVQELAFVDLAGSEWAKDQSHHTKERLAETKVINSSLYTLKRCLRLKIAQDEQLTTNSTGSVPPVRESQITRLLSPVFLDRGARLVLVSCVSPSSSDIDHGMATLAHCSLPTVGDAVEEKADFSIAGEKVFVTSVPGIAMHDLETVDSQRGDATAVQDLESGGTPAAPSTNDPSLWTPGQVVQWYEDAAGRAYHTIMDAFQQRQLPTHQDKTTTTDVGDLLDARFTLDVVIDAEKIAKETSDALKFGLVFKKTSESDASESDSRVVPLEIERVVKSGLVGRSIQGSTAARYLKPGCVLVGVALLTPAESDAELGVFQVVGRVNSNIASSIPTSRSETSATVISDEKAGRAILTRDVEALKGALRAATEALSVGVADHAAWLADDSERKRLRAHQFSYADLFSGIFLGAQAESTCGQMFISSLFFAPRKKQKPKLQKQTRGLRSNQSPHQQSPSSRFCRLTGLPSHQHFRQCLESLRENREWGLLAAINLLRDMPPRTCGTRPFSSRRMAIPESLG
eukprot:INCI3315.2.p1 GENE.INCI3315.2~~INCI3315.2.p1  ORF type:complete len:850 (-),score=152.19 INCI3315.2:2363-4912(-)